MAILDFDPRFFEAWNRAERDPDSAAEALLIIAGYLRAGQTLDRDMTNYLAGAIEASMRKPQKQRGPALLRELRLTAGNRRPANVDEQAVWSAFDDAIGAGKSQNAAATQVAADFGIGESTAVKIWKTYRKALEEHDQITHDDDIDG